MVGLHLIFKNLVERKVKYGLDIFFMDTHSSTTTQEGALGCQMAKRKEVPFLDCKKGLLTVQSRLEKGEPLKANKGHQNKLDFDGKIVGLRSFTNALRERLPEKSSSKSRESREKNCLTRITRCCKVYGSRMKAPVRIRDQLLYVQSGDTFFLC